MAKVPAVHREARTREYTGSCVYREECPTWIPPSA